jgi:hypothetical protein
LNHVQVAVITMSATAQETRRRALLELERRFCDNRTEVLNDSAVVKSTHELVGMGLDLRLSTYPDTPLSEFKAADTYVRTRGGLETR